MTAQPGTSGVQADWPSAAQSPRRADGASWGRRLATAMDRETEGREYLAQHKIPELLYSLTSLLLYHRPERPREFLIKTLEKVKISRVSNADYPNLMDESNLDAMFDMIDVGGQGFINVIQYKGALESLGLSTEDVIYEENEIITSSLFKENIMKKFAELWRTV